MSQREGDAVDPEIGSPGEAEAYPHLLLWAELHGSYDVGTLELAALLRQGIARVVRRAFDALVDRTGRDAR